MIKDRTMIYLQRTAFRRRTQVWVEQLHFVDGTASRTVVANIEFKKVDEAESAPPTCELTDEDAQFLMDELYRNGFRPSDQPNTATALAATEHHLEDMRRLVEHATGAKLHDVEIRVEAAR